MQDFISVQGVDKKSYTIFTKHIVYIGAGEKGIAIHLNAGGQHVTLEVPLTHNEILDLIIKKVN